MKNKKVNTMLSVVNQHNPIENKNIRIEVSETVDEAISRSFDHIAPCWPLKNIIAVNPLQGFENESFEKALELGEYYFQQKSYPEPLQEINRIMIKWLQSYLDEGQSTLAMPNKNLGFYASWRMLCQYDADLHHYDPDKILRLSTLSKCPQMTILTLLDAMEIHPNQYDRFLTLLLTSLPGWASYVKYLTQWKSELCDHTQSLSQLDYLAVRIVITYLIWPESKTLLTWFNPIKTASTARKKILDTLEDNEALFQKSLLKKIRTTSIKAITRPDAQFVFCIDVRSEPYRKALESQGNYETFGFAGFFGIPLSVNNAQTHEKYPSCPVLLTSKHEIRESASNQILTKNAKTQILHNLLSIEKWNKAYQSMKYNFISPFALAEAIGLFSGLSMAIKSVMPQLTLSKNTAQSMDNHTHCLDTNEMTLLNLDTISLSERCEYAKNALCMMGLTQRFSPYVILCGHGSTTENNPYATALDCGACGGRHGGLNARVLAAILNQAVVRNYLQECDIHIPDDTLFIAAEHNTTTDHITLYHTSHDPLFESIQSDLNKASESNQLRRLQFLDNTYYSDNASHQIVRRSMDWGQVRPEWGLAKNCAFIIGPREKTASVDLEGRCFLHSYEYTCDPMGEYLTTILTAPMIVAQWINAQYLFSTLDNTAYGSGSKVTCNITGKFGIMQGNASDLMTGLPLQSVNHDDNNTYHEPMRLLTVVYAPLNLVDKIIHEQPTLINLFKNGWVNLICIDNIKDDQFRLTRELKWEAIS